MPVHPLPVNDAGGGGDGQGLNAPPENQDIISSPGSELPKDGLVHPLQVEDTDANERGEDEGGDGRGLDGTCDEHAEVVAGEPAHHVATSSSSISSHASPKTFSIACGGFSIIALLHVFWFVMIGSLGRHGWDVNNFSHAERIIFALLTILLPFFDFTAAVVGVQECLKRQDQVKVMLPSTPIGKDITHFLE